VVVSGIGVLGPESDPARVRTLVNALVKAGAREVLFPELQGGGSYASRLVDIRTPGTNQGFAWLSGMDALRRSLTA